MFASLKYIANPQEYWTMFNEQIDKARLGQLPLDQALKVLTERVDEKLRQPDSQ